MDDLAKLVQSLEERRAAATVAGDLASLEQLLCGDAVYSHSTGGVDSRASLLARIESGELAYQEISPRIDHAVAAGKDVVIGTGVLKTVVLVHGDRKVLDKRYSAVWTRQNDRWLLLALQG